MTIFGSYAKASGGARSAPVVVSDTLVTDVGDLILVGVGWSNDTVGTCTGIMDVAGNSFTPGTQHAGPFGSQFQWFWCNGATHASAINAFTASFSFPTNNNTIIFVWDIPLSGVAVFDVDVTSDGGTDRTTAEYSTTGLDEFVAVEAYDQFGSGGYTAETDYTLDSASFGTFGGAESIIFSSAQTDITSTFPGGSSGSGAFALGFKAEATFSISGSAGVAGATVAYSGTSSGSVMADGSGNYEIDGLADGDYVITPSLAGYTFSPTSHDETISGSDLTGVNFTATANPTGPTRSTRSK